MEPDGSYTPETYGVAVGGMIGVDAPADAKGHTLVSSDPSIDHTTFAEVAGVVEQALRPQNYAPTAEPRNAKLLIVVYWGRTAGTNAFGGAGPYGGPSDSQSRFIMDLSNARLLGFQNEGHLFDQGFDDPTNIMANIRREVHSATMDAIEDDRYVVIMEAFDFQQVWKNKKVVRLWETRFSLSQRHNDFRDSLPKMAQAAERYFGTETGGVAYAGPPDGRVEIGALRSLGEAKP